MVVSSGFSNGNLNSTFAQQGAHRLGLSLAAGKLTVLGSNGKPLSESNPGYVAFQNPSTPGLLSHGVLVANQTVTDGAGQLDTWRAGIPVVDALGNPSSDWSSDMPLFLYGVIGTAGDVAIMLSRNPCAQLSPAAASISKAGAILNVDQNDFFSLLGGTIANYASRPCVCLGAVRVRSIVNAGTIRYTFQALTNNDGFGNYHTSTVFTLPTGVNGAAVSSGIINNVGTVPIWTTQTMTYTIDRNGFVRYMFDGQAPSVNGVGVNTLQPVLPYACCATREEVGIFANYTTAGTYYVFTGGAIGTSQAYIAAFYQNATAIPVPNNAFAIASANALQFSVLYCAFDN